MTNPLVSVVIPTYYRNDRLSKGISSVQKQRYEPIETIVIDGSEKGVARSVVNEFQDLNYEKQADYEGIKGAAGGRDIGVSAASGSLVRFLDDDDRLKDPTAIGKQVEKINGSDTVGVIYSGLEWENGTLVLPDPQICGNILEHALRLQTAPCLPSTMLIKKSLLEDLPPLRSLVHDDAAMTIELAQRSEFDYVDEPLIIRGNSDESLGGSISSLQGRKQVIKMYNDLYDQFPPEVRNTALGRLHLQEAQVHLREHFWSHKAILSLIFAIYYFPRVNLPSLGALLAALFGRPGWNFGFKLYSKYFLGDKRRGNINKIP